MATDNPMSFVSTRILMPRPEKAAPPTHPAKPTAAEIEEVMTPLLEATAAVSPAQLDARYWSLAQQPDGRLLAFRRWTIPGHATLDVFDLSDPYGRSWFRAPERYYRPGAETMQLVQGIRELDDTVGAMAKRKLAEFFQERIAYQVRAKWPAPPLTALAFALRGMNWDAFQARHPAAEEAHDAAVQLYLAAVRECGEAAADDCWNDNTPNRFNR